MLLNKEKLNIFERVVFLLIGILILFINLFIYIPDTFEIILLLALAQFIFNSYKALKENRIENKLDYHMHSWGSEVKYFIYLYENGNGHIKTAKEAREGDIIRLKSACSENISLSYFKMTPDLIVWDIENKEGHFIMPSCDVSIEATFKDNRSLVDIVKKDFSKQCCK